MLSSTGTCTPATSCCECASPTIGRPAAATATLGRGPPTSAPAPPTTLEARREPVLLSHARKDAARNQRIVKSVALLSQKATCDDECYAVTHATVCCPNSNSSAAFFPSEVPSAATPSSQALQKSCALAAMVAKGWASVPPGCRVLSLPAAELPRIWEVSENVATARVQGLPTQPGAQGAGVAVYSVDPGEVNNLSVDIAGDYHAPPVIDDEIKDMLKHSQLGHMVRERGWVARAFGVPDWRTLQGRR
mmetsp:Transcript_86876/g.243403  ORF Transcript_86876/g.243403 Transcript_86876/m.243403 type:complete len:248 (-) Transcript_86876:32-775(-)